MYKQYKAHGVQKTDEINRYVVINKHIDILKLQVRILDEISLHLISVAFYCNPEVMGVYDYL